jgi:rubrerythrin
MELADLLDRCCGLETRSGALYRRFAEDARRDPELRAFWVAMAREEDEHARTLSNARDHLPTAEAWVTRLSARWERVVREVEAKLLEAERLADGASIDQQLATALDLEMTEIDALHGMLLAVSRHRPPRPIDEHHAVRLADAAERFGAHPHVRKQAALLRARARHTARDQPGPGRLPARAARIGLRR